MGSKGYYERVQEILDGADLVLFEGVGGDAEGFLRAEGGDESKAGSMQVALANALGLEYQLFAVEYDRPHFVNSDMSLLEFAAILSGQEAEELSEEGRKRLMEMLENMEGVGLSGEIMKGLMRRVEGHPGFQRGLAWAVVEILGGLRGDLSEIRGVPSDMRELMNLLIRRRNDVVVRDVGEVLEGEDPPGDMVVFYGAAHMHDLQKRLVNAHGLELVETEWLPAFSGSLHQGGLNSVQKGLLGWFVRQQASALERMMPGAEE